MKTDHNTISGAETTPFGTLTKLRVDSGENSIMQTISIAVSAILIAAGLITAPSLINNARDTNAKNDLASISMAEEFALSNYGAYAGSTIIPSNTSVARAGSVTILTDTVAASADVPGGVKLTLSGDPASEYAIQINGLNYTATVRSKSGNFFSRSNGSTAVTAPTKVVPTGSFGIWP